MTYEDAKLCQDIIAADLFKYLDVTSVFNTRKKLLVVGIEGICERSGRAGSSSKKRLSYVAVGCGEGSRHLWQIQAA